MTLTIASKKAIRYACMNFHYAKTIPSAPIAYNVFNGGGEWCGVIIYSQGATVHIGTPYNLLQGEICELVRVALNGKQESTNQAVAMSLRQLHKDAPLVRLVISYADKDQNHLGTIYQATNWIYTGDVLANQKDKWFVNGQYLHNRTISSRVKRAGGTHGLTREEFIKKYFDENAVAHITKGRHKYLMPLDKKMRKQIQPLAKPYPKNKEDWEKIDRNTFKKKEGEL